MGGGVSRQAWEEEEALFSAPLLSLKQRGCLTQVSYYACLQHWGERPRRRISASYSQQTGIISPYSDTWWFCSCPCKPRLLRFWDFCIYPTAFLSLAPWDLVHETSY